MLVAASWDRPRARLCAACILWTDDIFGTEESQDPKVYELSGAGVFGIVHAH